jgi:hypothetical protein
MEPIRSIPKGVRYRAPKSWKQTCFGVLLAVTLALGSAIPAASKTVFPSQGSGGDRTDTDMCPQGQYLAGFAGRVGSWIDQIQIICAAQKPDGSFAAPNHYGPVRGGNSGSPQEKSCGDGSVIKSMAFVYTEQFRQVKWVDMKCFNPTSRQESKISFDAAPDFGDASQQYNNLQECPNGEMAQGVNISSGRHVNGMGLICDRLVRAAPPPPPVAAAVQGPARTGRVIPYGKKPPTVNLSFEGPWEMTGPNGTFNMTLVGAGTPFPGTYYPPAYTGVLVNLNDNRYNGTISATMPQPNGMRIEFNFAQPGAGTGGNGMFVMNGDGTIAGQVNDAKAGAITWTGRRK